jgi:hypothetical protein
MPETLTSPTVAKKPRTTERQRYLKRWSAVKTNRSSWESEWREIAELTAPRRFRANLSDSKGKKKNEKVLNPIGQLCIRTLAAGMMAGITSPSRPWMRLGIPEDELAEVESIKAWAWECTERMLSQLRRTNFYLTTASSVYVDLGTMATHCTIVLRDRKTCLRFYPKQVGSYWLASSSRGEIDTVYEEHNLTVGQLVEEFGYDACTARVQRLFDEDKVDTDVPVLHVIEPNRERQLERGDARGMPFRSVWMEAANAEDRQAGFLRESGHRRFPALVPRWAVDGEETYGTRSPGMDARPTLRQLQKLEYRLALQIALLSSTPVSAPTSVQDNGGVNISPKGVTWIPTSGGQAPELKATVDTAAIQRGIESVEKAIATREQRAREFFFVDFWLAMLQDPRATPATAEEIRAKKEERMLQLGPVLEQIQTEYLEPLIDMLFEAMMEDGLLPPPPRELVEWLQAKGLQAYQFDVEYVSIAAAAQKALGLTNVRAFLEIVAQGMQVDAQALDNVDVDTLVQEAGRILGINPKILKAMDVVKQLRAARAKQQQAADMGAAMATGAKAAKDLGTTPAPASDNMLGALGPVLQAMGPQAAGLMPQTTKLTP